MTKLASNSGRYILTPIVVEAQIWAMSTYLCFSKSINNKLVFTANLSHTT
jgi:hypothetical protein